MTGPMAFVELVFSKLQQRAMTSDWNADQLANALSRAMAGPPPMPLPPPIAVDEKSIHNLSDTTMIHDMLRRGYAVMKIPEDGKLKGLSDG